MSRMIGALALCILLGVPAGVRAQSTDGYHAIQVLPVVVDSASFTQRITVRNPSTQSLTIDVDYFPANGTAQPLPLACSDLVVGPESDTTTVSLRTLCPTLAAGSNFGTLVMRTNLTRTFSLFSRVSNPQGAGFSVEGFAAYNFTGADAVVTGLRRSAATAGSPAYQSNCFVGNLGEITPGGAPAVNVDVQLWQGDVGLGATTVSVAPGRLVRLLDVFSAAGLWVEDFDNVRAVFVPFTAVTTPALITFCTVQDNTSFGADFRIGKTDVSVLGMGAQSDLSLRESAVTGDYRFSGSGSVRPFAIPAGATRNVHTLYFRTPDFASCALLDPTTNVVVTPAYGLEMRLLALPPGTTTWLPVIGGNDTVSFANVFLGDKNELNNALTSRYLLEVESNGSNAGSSRPYKLHCNSGSGHTLGELSLTGAALAF